MVGEVWWFCTGTGFELELTVPPSLSHLWANMYTQLQHSSTFSYIQLNFNVLRMCIMGHTMFIKWFVYLYGHFRIVYSYHVAATYGHKRYPFHVLIKYRCNSLPGYCQICPLSPSPKIWAVCK